MIRELRRTVAVVVWGAMLLAGIVTGIALLRRDGHPSPPWAALDLSRDVGRTAGIRLAMLGDDPARCRALLTRAGINFSRLSPVNEGVCGYRDAVRFDAGGSRRIALTPGRPALACPVAAALAMWEWTVVQPSALRQLGSSVIAIDHLGSYACRRIGGRQAGAWSEHASANAIDVAGFRLADGRRVTVVDDWRGDDAAARFLHDVRDGACGLFATVLSPDYNPAHRDHLHLDQASRGWGGRACR